MKPPSILIFRGLCTPFCCKLPHPFNSKMCTSTVHPLSLLCKYPHTPGMGPNTPMCWGIHWRAYQIPHPLEDLDPWEATSEAEMPPTVRFIFVLAPCVYPKCSKFLNGEFTFFIFPHHVGLGLCRQGLWGARMGYVAILISPHYFHF